MKITERISGPQMIVLVTLFHESAMLLFIPALLARRAGPDAWLAVPLAIVGGVLPVAVLIGVLMKYHPGKRFGDIAETCLGRWLGRAATLIYAGFSVFVCSLVIRNIMDFTHVSMLPGTPLLVIGVIFTGVLAYGAYCGLEVIARLGFLVLLLKVVAIIPIPFMVVEDVERLRMLPVMGQGLQPILAATVPMLGWVSEVFAMMEVAAYQDKPRRTFRVFLLGTLGAGAILEGFTLLTLLTFGDRLTQTFLYPVYGLIREVTVGEFMERIEIVLLTIWMGGMVIKGALCLWAGVINIAHAFRIKRYRFVIPPAALAALLTTYLWQSVVHEMKLSTSGLWNLITGSVCVLMPGLLVLISWVRSFRRAGVGA